jgi:hypothetical protein
MMHLRLNGSPPSSAAQSVLPEGRRLAFLHGAEVEAIAEIPNGADLWN